MLAGNDGRVTIFFGHVIDPRLVKTWGPADKTQYIFEAEVLPFAVALKVWGDVLIRTVVFSFSLTTKLPKPAGLQLLPTPT